MASHVSHVSHVVRLHLVIGTPLCYCFVAGGKIRAKAGKFKRDPKLQLFEAI